MKKLITGIIVSISALLMLGITGFAAEGVKIPYTDYVSGSTTQGLNTRKDAIKQYSGSAVGYKINTETSPTSVTLTIGTDATNAGIAELRLDSKGGTLLGTVDVSSKAFSWRGVDFSIPISQDISGEHTLWVCFTKGQHDFYGITLKIPDPNSAYYPFSDENLFTDIDDYGSKNELNLLAGLGILDSGDAFDPERLAVKRDLIKALAGFFRDTAGWETGAIYADITPEDPDYKAFSVLCSMGIIEKNPTKQFKPNERLTVDWACQISCRVLSFGFPDTIKLNNMQIAKRLGLLDGVSSGPDMCRKDMAKLLYNMLDANYADVVGVVDTALKYDIKECILERTRNIYQGEGVVSANQSYNIYSNEEMAARDRVIIDSIQYHADDERAVGYAGLKCTFFYEDNDGIRTIVAIAPHRDAEYVRVNSGDKEITDISDKEITYYEGDDEEKLRLSENIIIMYNGRIGEGSLKSLVGTGNFTGELLLMDNDSDGRYDVMFVEQPKTIVYKGIGTNAIYNGIDALKDAEEVVFDDMNNVKIYLSGAAIEWSDLELGDVLDLYASKNTVGDRLYRLHVSNAEGEGTIVSFDSKGKIKLSNGNQYERANGFSGNFVAGEAVVLKLNGYGQYAVIERESDAKVGIILHKGIMGKNFNKSAVVELLTQDNEIKRIYFSDKVTADGVFCSTLDELNGGKAPFVGLAALSEQIPVLYRLNDDGKIIMLDTPEPGAGGVKDQITCLMEETAVKIINGNVIGKGSNPQFEHLLGMSRDVQLVSLYSDDLKNLNNFGKPSVNHTTDITITAYSTKKDSMLADLLIRSTDVVKASYNGSFMYEEQALTLNADGDVCVLLKGTVGGAEKEYAVSPTVYGQNNEIGENLRDAIEVLREGDIVQFGLNPLGEVEFVQVDFFADAAYSRQTAAGKTVTARVYDDGVNINTVAHYAGSNLTTCYFGTVVAQEENFLKLERKSGGSTTYSYVNTAGVPNIIICKDEDGKFEIDRKASYMEIGLKSTVFVSDTLHSWGSPAFIAVYK